MRRHSRINRNRPYIYSRECFCKTSVRLARSRCPECPESPECGRSLPYRCRYLINAETLKGVDPSHKINSIVPWASSATLVIELDDFQRMGSFDTVACGSNLTLLFNKTNCTITLKVINMIALTAINETIQSSLLLFLISKNMVH